MDGNLVETMKAAIADFKKRNSGNGIDKFIAMVADGATKIIEDATEKANEFLTEQRTKAQQEASELLERARRDAEQIMQDASKNASRMTHGVEGGIEESMPQDHPRRLSTEMPQETRDDYPLRTERSDTLVIHCSDSRFQEAFNLFLREELDLQIYDSLIVPGASQLLTFSNSLPKFFDALARPMQFLIKAHELKRVVLIMHEDCAWYHGFVTKFARLKSDMKEHQKHDMLVAKQIIQNEFPHVEVNMFYAGMTSNDKVQFVEVKEVR